MAAAIKHVSVQRGYDVSKYTLVCFGGAGGQHACRIADALGMRSIFIHRLAGVLSAYGMGLAPVRAHREAAVGQALSEELIAALDVVAAPLEAACRAELKDQGIAADGRVDELGPADETQVEIGDVVVIETPGGGGYGEA